MLQVRNWLLITNSNFRTLKSLQAYGENLFKKLASIKYEKSATYAMICQDCGKCSVGEFQYGMHHLQQYPWNLNLIKNKYAEKPQIKINSFKKQKHWYIIYTYLYDSRVTIINIFMEVHIALRVTLRLKIWPIRNGLIL